MKDKLNNIIISELNALRRLLEELENQHKCVIEKDVFGMEDCVSRIKEANKQIAVLEVKRREICGDRAVSELVNEFNDKELEDNYRETRRVLHSIKLQNETNDLLIRQGLSYTNQMLSILNPASKNPSTYNSYGKSRR